jgi:large subunit ribosomal protein L10e
MGDPKGKYDVVLHLIAQKAVQIRHNALEAARIDANKFVSKRLGKNYFFKILVYPFQVLREKPIAMGAGADRFSQGMRLAFGKPVGTAVRTRPGQRLMSLWVKKEDVEVARKALKRAGFKLPTPVRIEVEEL